MTKAQQCTSGIALYVLLGVTLLVYWPGLQGPLVLDDISNLHRLSDIGTIDSWSRFFQFIFSSSTSYPSRPLSLASFLINDVAWPLYVPAQKYTNVLIHLLDGVLVFWLAWLLCGFSGLKSRIAAAVSLTATALWLLAPLLVSTVLYLIQRMTELSALFVLCGLIAYCYGRRRLNDHPVSALAGMTAGIGVFAILGFLCKENAVLLGLYAAAVEYCLLSKELPVTSARVRRWFACWRWLVLVAPVVLAFAAIVFVRHAIENYKYRPFTLFQRIVSEPRILFDYIQNLFVPIRHGMGVTHDDFVLSTGWLSPPATVICVALLILAFVVALYLSRKHASVFGFGVLWFLAGHLMESSFIPLEPYFEHRNYLPAFGLYFALSYFIWTNRLEVAKYVKIGLVLYLAAFAIVTRQNVDVWTSEAAMGETWARDHPLSVRAHQIRADVWSRAGRSEKAFAILSYIARVQPHTMGPQIQELLQACRSRPGHIKDYLKKIEARIPKAYFDHAVIPTLVTLRDSFQKDCPKLSADDMLGLASQIMSQKSVLERNGAVSDLLYLQATLLAKKGQAQAAVSHLYAAFKLRPSYALGLASVEFLYNLKQYAQALKALDDVKAIHLKPWESDYYRGAEIRHWQRRIEQKLDHEAPGKS